MRVCKHAVRRYKQRVGGRSASRDNIVRAIKSEIHNHTVKQYMTKAHLYIETTKFIAVCYKGTILTILPLGPLTGDEDIGLLM